MEDINELIRLECMDQRFAEEDRILTELAESSKLNGGEQ